MQVVNWDDHGQAHSILYPDIYRSRGADGDHGLAQARHVFLGGCQLLGEPAVWRHRPQWCVLENGFGLGLNFLATWQAWRLDPGRPALLHYVATEAHPVQGTDLLRSTRPWPQLHALTQPLVDGWWGLLPGVHRFALDGGAVLLDLVIGDSALSLPQLDLQADSIYLDGFSPRANPGMWGADVLGPLTRLSRPGTLWATWCVAGTVTRTLAELGLQITKRPGLAPKRECLRACWPGPTGSSAASAASPVSRSAEPVWVLGAGLAGASVARSLAERGRPVVVVDAIGPASGASGVPAGMVACHTSHDDLPLSRLTRMGLRHTLARLQDLQPGHDWSPSGLDEFRPAARARRGPPGDSALRRGWHPHDSDLSFWRRDWWQPFEGGWHQAHAAWLQPGALVRQLLNHPGIECRFGWEVESLRAEQAGWQIETRQHGLTRGIGQLVVAMGPHSATLLATLGLTLHLQSVRGQLSLGSRPDPVPASWPARPRSGEGSLLPDVPLQGQRHWLVGSSFDHSRNLPLHLQADQTLNAQRWERLAPDSAAHLPPMGQWRSWVGVRAAVHDRLPWVGPLAHPSGAGLWLLAGLGSRGLTLATLGGEHLAARLTGTPDALPGALRQAWSTERGRYISA